MKNKSLYLILFLLLTFLSTTGEQCDVNSLLFGGNAEYTAIRDVVNKFKEGINSASESLLTSVISSQYKSGGIDQVELIKKYFDQELKINDINVSNISIDGKGARCNVDWTGTLTMRPKPNIPYVADKIPVLSGDVTAGMIFGFAKEDDGKWRITAQKVLRLTRSAVWGEKYPEIEGFTADKSTVKPGGTLKVDATLKRVGGNVMLAAVNGKAIVNSIYGSADGPIKTIKLNVPSNKKSGSTFDVYVMAVGIDANFVNPKASKIVGITLKQVSVPVE